MKFAAVLLISWFVFRPALQAQVPDTLFFNLYTDSLKKGTYNYINVVGKYKDSYLPLTQKELHFRSDAGIFEGNSLFIDTTFAGEKIRICAMLRADTTRKQEIVLYIKTTESQVPVKTEEEVLRSKPPQRSRRHRF